MIKNIIVKKGLIVGIALIFFGTCIIPATAQDNEITLQPTSRGNWLYVGGNGPGNYSKIQYAIDNSSDGDIVFVLDDSSPYIENVIVNKKINLIGEDKSTTVIDANYKHSAVQLESNYITISGFTLQNSGPEEWHDSGIHLGTMNNRANYCNILDNKIINNFDGIYSLFPTENLIENNIIANNKHNGITLHGSGSEGKVRIANNTIIDNSNSGIVIYDPRSNIIYGNIIMNNGENGIYFGTYGNSIFRNIIKNHTYGIRDAGGTTHIYSNTIEDNEIGLFAHSIRSTFEMNNFVENDCNAKYHILFRKSFNHWKSNYWDDYGGIGPKVIEGISSKNYFHILAYICLSLIYLRLTGELPPWPEPELEEYPTKEYDWRPAKKPYDI